MNTTATFLLVTGSMRSGTTLLGELLYSREPSAQRHPQLAFDNDRVITVRNLSQRLRENAASGRIAAEDPYLPIPFSPPLVARHFGNEKEDLTESGAGELLAQKLQDEILFFAPSQEPARVFGLKSTHLFTEIDFLKRAFPRVLTAVMVRDPRDVLASNQGRLDKFYPQTIVSRILLTILAYHYFLEARQNDPDVVVLRYEDLVREPVSHISNLLTAAGIDPQRYDWDSLKRGRVSSNSSWNDDQGIKMQANAGIFAKSVGTYRRHLSDLQVYASEILLGPYMQRFGYTAEGISSPALHAKFTTHFLPELYREAVASGVSLAPLKQRLRELKLDQTLNIESWNRRPLLTRINRKFRLTVSSLRVSWKKWRASFARR